MVQQRLLLTMGMMLQQKYVHLNTEDAVLLQADFTSHANLVGCTYFGSCKMQQALHTFCFNFFSIWSDVHLSR